MTLPTWNDAACKMLPLPDAERLFFPQQLNFEEGRKTAATARAICASCPILSDCREWALNHPMQASHGTWGGLTATERNDMLRNNRRRAA